MKIQFSTAIRPPHMAIITEYMDCNECGKRCEVPNGTLAVRCTYCCNFTSYMDDRRKAALACDKAWEKN